MIPFVSEDLTEDIIDEEIPSKDFFFDLTNNRINGSVEGIEAVKQSIFLILNTERYNHEIYDWDYGVELEELIGQPMNYIIPEAERRITEALLQDDRILSVGNFEFEKIAKNTLHVTFTVTTNFGDIESEVDINV